MKGMLLFRVFAVWLIWTGDPAWSQAVDGQTVDWETRKIGEKDYVPLERLKGFYRFDGIEREGKGLVMKTRMVSMGLESGSREMRLNRTKVVLDEEVKEVDGEVFISSGDLVRVIDPILRPNLLTERKDFRTVILDPAYGGTDQGSRSEWGTAADYSLEIAKLAKVELEKWGFRVVMTREEDRDVGVQERMEIANRVGNPAVYIGITFDGYSEGRRGVSTEALWVPDGRVEEEGEDLSRASMALGMAVHGALVHMLGQNMEDQGLGKARAEAMSGVLHPRIFVNAGDLTQETDAKLAANGKYRAAVARALFHGMTKYRPRVSRGKEE